MAAEPILIVEDNQINLMLVKVLLATKGYDIHTANDAHEALVLLEHLHPCLIIMDIQLPGMDGLELTRKLKADPQYQDIAIIAVTAYAMKGDKEKALAAGCDGYIAKPIEAKTFADTITEYLHKR
ncbi:MAG: response regulator [Gammaproteobacteria bacterium]|nr:MAG: response regulator [Gammaproteobacteria bacterium]